MLRIIIYYKNYPSFFKLKSPFIWSENLRDEWRRSASEFKGPRYYFGVGTSGFCFFIVINRRSLLYVQIVPTILLYNVYTAHKQWGKRRSRYRCLLAVSWRIPWTISKNYRIHNFLFFSIMFTHRTQISVKPLTIIKIISTSWIWMKICRSGPRTPSEYTSPSGVKLVRGSNFIRLERIFET